jgi:hypothetical protein
VLYRVVCDGRGIRILRVFDDLCSQAVGVDRELLDGRLP